MKTHYYLLAGFMAIAMLSACNNHSRDKDVEKQFKNMFPKSTHEKWKEKEGFHIVDFVQYGYEKEAWFDENSVWWLTRKDLTNKVPHLVKQAVINNGYGEWNIGRVEYIDIKGNDSFYILEIEKTNTTVNLYLTASGHMLERLPKSKVFQIYNAKHWK